MTDSTMTEIPHEGLVGRRTELCVAATFIADECGGELRPKQTEQLYAMRELMERDAATLKAAVEALEESRSWLSAISSEEMLPSRTAEDNLRELVTKIDNTLASLKQPGGR